MAEEERGWVESREGSESGRERIEEQRQRYIRSCLHLYIASYPGSPSPHGSQKSYAELLRGEGEPGNKADLYTCTSDSILAHPTITQGYRVALLP